MRHHGAGLISAPRDMRGVQKMVASAVIGIMRRKQTETERM